MKSCGADKDETIYTAEDSEALMEMPHDLFHVDTFNYTHSGEIGSLPNESSWLIESHRKSKARVDRSIFFANVMAPVARSLFYT